MRKPRPKRAYPANMILRGPKRSMRNPSTGPRRLLSSLVKEKARESVPPTGVQHRGHGQEEGGKPVGEKAAVHRQGYSSSPQEPPPVEDAGLFTYHCFCGQVRLQASSSLVPYYHASRVGVLGLCFHAGCHPHHQIWKQVFVPSYGLTSSPRTDKTCRSCPSTGSG